MTTSAEPDYWSLLGLDPDADPEALKRAFRREARRWHPDLNGNDSHAEERFKLVNEAYAVLSNPDRRKEWQSGRQGSTVSADPFSSGFPAFEDYLAVVLGLEREPIRGSSFHDDDPAPDAAAAESHWPEAAPPPPPPVRTEDDLETVVALTPDQALHGTTVELELGDGTLVEVGTPPRAGDGWRLRLEGVAPGGKDHFLHLRVITDDGLRIDGLRVHYRLELLPPDAALGCAVDVPTLSGPVTLQVPPGSSSGRLLRLRGRGLQLDDDRGDQLVEIVIVIPAELADDERALYQRLQELSLERAGGY
ncbi:DnaJ type II chaperone protein [Synechococcus sp. A18-25c]|uniref:DnaJ C-terminal domain-containing protein n=1 Tax=unclassified Synechococcus TaxID=2626047 RepID=UPI001646C65F|nr:MULTISPECIES: DnaJ C-terminal domain-containing protein [unclassified Synechococcus]QNI48386.1 DnaJ type II chaperone protein [Synechococcus sp. A15-60]QNJ20012.1 DnaJ type II chaperone protein [Synechococcus sp. A18-25c]